MSGILATFGASTEDTYGTYKTPDHWLEVVQEGFKLKTGRIESKSLGRGNMLRADRWVVDRQGAAGSLDLELRGTGFEFWMQHMLGNVTTVANSDGTTTFLGTRGPLNGKSFTFVVNRPDITGTLHPFAYVGCKVTDWEIDAAVGSLLAAKLSVEAKDEDVTQPVAAANYPATPSELLACNAATIQIGGVSVDVQKWTIKGVNNLDVSRRFLSASGTGVKEALESGMRTITVSADIEFNDMTMYNRAASMTRAGALASFSATFAGHETIGTGSAVPSLSFTMPAVRIDGDAPTVTGPQLIKWTVSGQVLVPTTGSEPLTAMYTTTDATV